MRLFGFGSKATKDDGRSFRPRASEKTAKREPRLVFDAADRARLADDRELSPYASITQEQVAGLLWACGEYFARTMWSLENIHPDSPIDVLNPESLQAHGTLRRAYGSIRRRDPPQGELADAVFTPPEQFELSYHKWVRETEHITRDQLVQLLCALDQYARGARRLDVFRLRDGTPIPGFMSRLMYAHNVLVDFRANPLTYAEFGERILRVIAASSGIVRASGLADR